MAISTIAGGGAFSKENIDAINANFALNISTGGILTVSGALTAQSTTDLQGAVTCDSTLAVTGRATLPILTMGARKMTLTAITADGAVDQHTAANYMFTKAGVVAATLAAPTVTTDDGIILSFTNTTTDQDTLTATGLFQGGGTAVNLATWPVHAGATLVIMAYQGKWIVISNNLVVLS